MNTNLLALTYAQLLILELGCQGVDRDTATRESYALYYREIFPRWPWSSSVLLQGMNILAQRTYRYGCLAATATHNAAKLRAWRDRLANQPGHGIDLDQLDRVLWLLETVRRVGEGQPVLEAARAAHDAHLHKPRQRRRPVEPAWLLPEVQAALDWTWHLLDPTSPRPKGGDAAWQPEQ
jgi:hypothetical protein